MLPTPCTGNPCYHACEHCAAQYRFYLAARAEALRQGEHNQDGFCSDPRFSARVPFARQQPPTPGSLSQRFVPGIVPGDGIATPRTSTTVGIDIDLRAIQEELAQTEQKLLRAREDMTSKLASVRVAHEKKAENAQHTRGVDEEFEKLQTERAQLAREHAALREQTAFLEREEASFEKERAQLAREQAALREQTALLESEKASYENEKVRVEKRSSLTSHRDVDEWSKRLAVDLRDDVGEVVVREQAPAGVEEALRRFFSQSSALEFSEVHEQQIKEMAQSMQKKIYKRNEKVFSEGDIGTDIFAIDSGSLQVLIGGSLRRVLRRGTIFGERALLHAERRTATVQTASEKATLWVMSKEMYGKISQVKLKASMDRLVKSGSPVFRNLSRADIASLMSGCVLQTFYKGNIVVRQGASGTVFYVVENGELQVSVDGRVVSHLSAGEYFGELALLGDGTRMATVKVLTDTADLWPVDKKAFLQATQHRLKATVASLKERSPGILKEASGTEIDALMDAAVLKVHREGDHVVSQGDAALAFYVVESGILRAIVDGKAKSTIREGEYFGERALLKDEISLFTAQVESASAEIWTVSRKHFLSAMHSFVQAR